MTTDTNLPTPVPDGDMGDIQPEPRPRWGRRVLLGVGGLLLLGAAAFGVSQTLAAKPTLRTATVQRGEIRSTVETNGRLEALTTAGLGFKAGGRLTRLTVQAGDVVTAGAVLAELDTATLLRSQQQATTERDIAQLRLQQAKDGPRPSDLAAAQADLQSALAALAEAQGGGQSTDIRAAEAGLAAAVAKRADLQRGPTAAQISTAQATLREAQAGLAKVQKGASADDIAAAQADVRQAQAGLDKVQAGATASDIAAAEAAVRQAQATLDRAKAPARTEDIAGAQAAVRQAQAGLDKAKAPARAEDIAGAQAAVRQAQANLAKVQAGATTQDLAVAQARLDAARASKTQVAATTSNAKEQARIAQDQAANRVRDAQQQFADISEALNRAYRDRGRPVPDEEQAREDAAMRAVQDAQGGLEQAGLAYEAAKQNEIAALAQADGAIREAQAALDTLRAGATPSDVAAAQAAVDQAQAALTKLQAGGSAGDVAAAQAAVDQAQATLTKLQNGALAGDTAAQQAAVDQAQAALAKLRAGPTAPDVAAAQAVVDQAQARLRKLQAGPSAEDVAAAQATVDRAQAALTEARSGARPDALREAQAGVDQAQANLDKVKSGATAATQSAAQARVAAAQAALDLKQQGPTATDLAILQQQVQLAQYTLDSATAALADARLIAPFAGTVLTVDPKVGELVGSSPILQLARLDTLRAQADIDELDVGRVRAGQAVTLTLDAYPGQKLPGVVESLAPGATQKSGSTVYQATVVFTPTLGVQPRPGMAAGLLITAASKSGVLVVPKRALENIGGQQYVTLVDGSVQRKQRVELGLSNATDSEIVDDGSLTVGQTVVVR